MKLISKKGKIETGERVCNNCGSEYIENENYNWSCRTHASEYGGKIWWCCGKTKITDKGCIK